MFCEAYRQPLADAAIGGELAAKLQKHLAVCPSCRAAFAEEQSFCATIDSALHIFANNEVPATLVPRVHVALRNEPMPPQPNRLWLFAVVPLLAASVLAFVYLSWRGSRGTVEQVQNIPNRIASTTPVIPGMVNVSPSRAVNRLQRGNAMASAGNRSSDPKVVEVIVEPEESAALLRYESVLRGRAVATSQTLSARNIELPQEIEPLEIAELEVGNLAIPALAKAEADADKK